jgi:chromate transporter
MATFAGFKAGGILGGILASLAVITTGTIFMLIISGFLDKFKGHVILEKAFYGIRPMVAALIAYAGYEMFQITILNGEALNINFISLGLFIVVSILLLKTKISPILLILFAAILGIFVPIA